ncbi:MAG: MFS transporter [Thermomicrobiales bacterium]
MARSSPGLSGRVTNENAKWFVLMATCVALFMAILDNLVVNVAIPTISEDLSPSASQLQWIVSAYTLVFASVQITAGGLGDRLGRKRMFLFGVAIFTATSGLAAFVNSTETLILARAVQGFGGAFIMPLSLSLVSQAFPEEERAKALGIWSAIMASGLAFGPIVGGLIVEYWSWHWIFLINVPIGIIALVLGSAVIRESKDDSGRAVTDIPGTVLVTAAIGLLTWGLIDAGERGWGDNRVLLSLLGSAIVFAAFIVVELRSANPMVPLGFFKSATFTVANIDSFVIAFMISGVAFSMTLYFQNVHGYSPMRSGLTMLPMVICMMVVSPFAGALVKRLGTSKLITLGMVITGGASFLFLRASASATFLDMVPAFMVMGIGNALIMAPMTTAVINSVESSKTGVASAVNGAVRETGFAFGVALLGSIMNQTYQDRFEANGAIAAMRATGDQALGGMLDVIARGINYAGHVIDNPLLFPGVPADIAASIREASAEAFVAGMDQAFVLSGIVMIATGIVSFFLVRDREAAPAPAPDAGATVQEPHVAVAPTTGE